MNILSRKYYFYIQNIYDAIKIKSIVPQYEDGFLYRGLKLTELSKLINLYKKLSPIPNLKFSRILFSAIFGNKLVIVVQDELNKELIGIGMYHFIKHNSKDLQVHQFFTGIDKNYQRKGLGTKLRYKAMQHFYKNKVKYISSNVSINNIPSLRSNEKIGFKPIKKFFDEQTHEETYILLCDLNKIFNK